MCVNSIVTTFIEFEVGCKYAVFTQMYFWQFVYMAAKYIELSLQ